MYEGFASVYDHMMEEIPYDAWCDLLCSCLAERGITGGTICELGCGTGSMTERLAAAGFDMIGVDLSPDMLAAAQRKKEQSGLDILYIQQDMEQLTLAEPVDVILSVCDSINYILEEDGMRRVFDRVYQFLKPGGYFIFDLKTIYCYRNIIGSRTLAEQDEDVSYIWENYFYEDEDINEYKLTIFCRQQESSLYEKIEEVHYQRAYMLPRIRELLEEAGLSTTDCFTGEGEEPREDSERIFIIAKRREDKS